MRNNIYEPVLSSQATQKLLGFSKKKQQELYRICYQLAQTPSQHGDYTQKDATGRSIQYLQLGSYVIGFWADHSVKEMRIIEISEI